MIACLVMTDGRAKCLARTLASAEENLNLDTMVRVIHDDSDDAAYHAWLFANYGDRWTIVVTPARSGFGGAIRSAWKALRAMHGITHVFHLEDDFVFPLKVPLHQMLDLLDDRPEVVQVALVRQPWNSEEQAAGGVLARWRERCAQLQTKFGEPYVAQRAYFTTNPCLYRRALIDHEWPEGTHSEGGFTFQLFHEGHNGVPGELIQFAFWGRLDDPPRCEHIGEHRIGTGY